MKERELFEQAVAQLGRLSRDQMRKAKTERSAPQRRPRQARFERRLARGEVDPGAVLDLHGLDRRRAVLQLRAFLKDQQRRDPAEVLVVHGKGARILAEAVTRELDRHPAVAEHLPAPARFGGQGARMVRLKAIRARS
jgi:DNA-nicking Smr family endonuclease